MDLSDVRKSLTDQGWEARNGRGSHVVWYSPDGTSRPIVIPSTRKAPSRQILLNLRAKLRQAGWIDPEFAGRIPLPARTQADPSTPATTIEGTTPAAASDETSAADAQEGTGMTSQDSLHVVEEAWVTNSRTGAVSDCIKEQLMSDESVRYRCAHPRGGDCMFVADTTAGIVGHMKRHGTMKRDNTSVPTTLMIQERAERATVTVRERTDKARGAVAQQIADAIATAESTGQDFATAAIVPHGMGAGGVSKNVLLVASPDGKIMHACVDCGWIGEAFASIYGHRRYSHPRNVHASAASASADASDTADASMQDASMAAPARMTAAASTPPPRPTAISEAFVAALERTPASMAMSLPMPPGAQSANGNGSATMTIRNPAAASVTSQSGGSFSEAVDYLREQTAQMVDHLRVLAAADYEHIAASRERDEELERTKARLGQAEQQLRVLTAEVQELRAEREDLLVASNKLKQLRGILGQVVGDSS